MIIIILVANLSLLELRMIQELTNGSIHKLIIRGLLFYFYSFSNIGFNFKPSAEEITESVQTISSPLDMKNVRLERARNSTEVSFSRHSFLQPKLSRETRRCSTEPTKTDKCRATSRLSTYTRSSASSNCNLPYIEIGPSPWDTLGKVSSNRPSNVTLLNFMEFIMKCSDDEYMDKRTNGVKNVKPVKVQCAKPKTNALARCFPRLRLC